MKGVGEPCAGEPHARFDGRGLETERYGVTAPAPDPTNEFIIQTFEFEGAPDMVNIEFMWFEDLGDGRSRLRGRSICPNTEARDGLLSSGMEGGMTEGYEKLDELLKTL